MALIRITRNIKLDEPLINSKGERVTQLRLNGSFAFNLYENEDNISYDRENNAYYYDLTSLIEAFTTPLQTQIDDLQSQIDDLQAQIDACCDDSGDGSSDLPSEDVSEDVIGDGPVV